MANTQNYQDLFEVVCIKCGEKGVFNIYHNAHYHVSYITVYHSIGRRHYKCEIARAEDEDIKLFEGAKNEKELREAISKIYAKAVRKYLERNMNKIYRRLYLSTSRHNS